MDQPTEEQKELVRRIFTQRGFEVKFEPDYLVLFDGDQVVTKIPMEKLLFLLSGGSRG